MDSIEMATYTRHTPDAAGALGNARFPFDRQPPDKEGDHGGSRNSDTKNSDTRYVGTSPVMDEERAAQVMEVIPSVDWASLATKQDIDALRKQDIEGLRKDLDGLRRETELRFEAIEQRMATKQDIAELKAHMGEMRAHMDETLRKHAYSLVGFVIAFAGVLVAAAHLS